ncbi:MAG TPA: outer membrane beta-barrel protein [Gemmatimonadales bacterium]|nr:outer membrane beta-barrel protein [Gemmatimonadales bacterium]
MKRTIRWIVGLALVLGAGSLGAQTRISLGGGLLMPMGTYSDNDKMGFIGQAGVGFPVGPVGIRVEGDYGQTSHKNGVGGNTKVIGGMASVVYHFKTPAGVKPYVLGGLGMYNVKVDVTGFGSASETKIAFGGGAGLELKMTGASLYLEARYMNVTTTGGSTAFIPITVGVRF